jgi:hypothetical protein
MGNVLDGNGSNRKALGVVTVALLAALTSATSAIYQTQAAWGRDASGAASSARYQELSEDNARLKARLNNLESRQWSIENEFNRLTRAIDRLSDQMERRQ